ncbi:MAG TPA: class I SAM-dependent methyltransferase [Nitrospirota bacterium]|nr:class I SAM-dependent methyltransferase [Nitrospirota bacterium]
MGLLKSPFRKEDRVCPWWLAWTFDNPLRRFFQEPEKIVGPFVREGMTVADIGCGMGYFTIPMAKIAGAKGTVLAVDIQEKMLEFTDRRAKRAGVGDRVRTIRASGDDIGIGEPVDLVLAFWMVHEVKDIPRFFGQLSSVLKEGGKILYVEPLFHVTERRFREILGYAKAAGLRTNEVPRIAFSRAVLLSKEGPS